MNYVSLVMLWRHAKNKSQVTAMHDFSHMRSILERKICQTYYGLFPRVEPHDITAIGGVEVDGWAQRIACMMGGRWEKFRRGGEVRQSPY